ncbi:MAG: hypothetical protein ACK55Z_22725, partial [bacterium]
MLDRLGPHSAGPDCVLVWPLRQRAYGRARTRHLELQHIARRLTLWDNRPVLPAPRHVEVELLARQRALR